MALDVTASGVSPNTDTCSSEGDLAGGGVSRAEPEASGGGYEGGRGDKALPVTGIACCGIAAGDVPLLLPGETPGGGRVIGLMTSSSIFGNAMPAALAALSAASLASRQQRQPKPPPALPASALFPPLHFSGR